MTLLLLQGPQGVFAPYMETIRGFGGLCYATGFFFGIC